MEYQNTLAFAQAQDQQDPLNGFKRAFIHPQVNGRRALYFCGNSLGLQPQKARLYVGHELDKWARQGVLGHFDGQDAWYNSTDRSKPALSMLVGAHEDEVVAMNALTPNLHFMMASFYRPEGKRYKILMEAGAFPSDQYAVESQVKLQGYAPDDAIIEVAPAPGHHTLDTAQIEAAIAQAGDSLALVLFPGIQYYTGQLFDMARIAKAGHSVGAMVGFDLAHAIGNVPMQLHEWQADFAVWCSYKYLNSGPGNVSGIFVHQKHGHNPETPRMAGWWGHDKAERFKMEKGFKPEKGADGWVQANNNILALAAHQASLDLFEQAGIEALRQKSLALTGYLEFILHNLETGKERIEILTPQDPAQRGCQLSLLIRPGGNEVFEAISEAGVICDWREPDVVRLAPAPMYNSFEEVYKLGQILAKALS